MIEHLGASYDLSGEDAYLLCSLCVDLRISEIVDAGQYVVSALLPLAVFRTLSGTDDGREPGVCPRPRRPRGSPAAS